MFDLLTSLFEYMNTHFSKIFDFLFWGVLIGYIGKRWVGDKLMEVFKRLSERTERTRAIWQHYMKRVDGHGHEAESVLDCPDEGCKTFRSYA